jgi:hypothetical protein
VKKSLLCAIFSAFYAIFPKILFDPLLYYQIQKTVERRIKNEEQNVFRDRRIHLPYSDLFGRACELFLVPPAESSRETSPQVRISEKGRRQPPAAFSNHITTD